MIEGDIITIEGQYKPRTLWQWLKRMPRQLKQFQITACTESTFIYDEVANISKELQDDKA